MSRLRIRDKVRSFPNRPGVYLFKEKSGKVLYVGKANSLIKRVSSYFKAGADVKVSSILSRATDIDFIITSNELEALLLESNLIKKYRPRYNIILRDDKQYPYIKVTLNEEWPRVLIVRKIEDDEAAYFGPYMGQTARNAIKMFKRLLQLRWCKKFKKRKEPCFYYHLKKCLAPCVGGTSRDEYMKVVNEAIEFLNGNLEGMIDKLKKEMQAASDAQDYEKAAFIRNRIRAFEGVLEKQEVLTTKKEDKDVVALAKLENKGMLLVLQIRGGKLVGKESYFIRDDKGESEDSLLYHSVIQYYTSLPKIPPEIVVKQKLPGLVTLQKAISKIKGANTIFVTARKGSDQKLYSMAEVNADYLLEQNMKLKAGMVESLHELKRILQIEKLPGRIEAFDISTIMGKETVGSMVVFIEGEPYKSDYRKFKVKIEGKPDDVSSIREVIRRRYTGSLLKSLPMPDLIIVDGGKPQVSAARMAVASTQAQDIAMAGLAKRLEEIYVPGKRSPLVLPRRSPALKLLQRIRDEAHRFAITYHRLRRKKAMLK